MLHALPVNLRLRRPHEETAGQGNPLGGIGISSNSADRRDPASLLRWVIAERKRKLAHAKAKAVQPELRVRGTAHHQHLFDKLKAFWDAPIDEHDKDQGPGAMEYLLLTLQDTLDAGDVEDLIFAALRVSRKALAGMPHLWRKQDFPQPQPAAESVK